VRSTDRDEDVDVTVRVLGTGGTIAASLEVDTIRLLPVADLCQALPSGLPSTEALDLERLPSSALQASDMLVIAHEVRRSLRAGVEGVVVTHGTDTLEETAFLTDLIVGDDSDLGGVVFTGAMRFASHTSPDGPGNLSDAVRLAACPAARGLGVLVAFDGQIHAARSVSKATTSGLQPFVSPSGAIGRMGEHEIDLDVEAGPRWPSGNDAETRVALVKAYPGMSGSGLEAVLLEGIKGVVIEGFGVLNVPETLLPAIERAIGDGVAVVVASRARTSGGLDQGPWGHRVLHNLGAVGSYGLSPGKAWVALMVGLARTDGSASELRAWIESITRR
jgi:L-asparaginase